MQALSVYRNIYKVLCTPGAMSSVTASLDELMAMARNEDSDTGSADVDVSEAQVHTEETAEEKASDTAAEKSLKDASPLHHLLTPSAKLLMTDVASDSTTAAKHNFCRKAMTASEKRCTCPLWAAALQNNVVRFAADAA